jgi:hypothetical protein
MFARLGKAVQFGVRLNRQQTLFPGPFRLSPRHKRQLCDVRHYLCLQCALRTALRRKELAPKRAKTINWPPSLAAQRL